MEISIFLVYECAYSIENFGWYSLKVTKIKANV